MFNEIKLLKFEDLVHTNANEKSMQSLNNLTNELEQQVTSLRDGDFNERLKKSIEIYECKIKDLGDTNTNLNIKYKDTTNKCDALQKRLDLLSNENKSLKEEINDLEPIFSKIASNQVLSEDNKDLIISKLNKKISNLKSTVETQMTSIKKLETQVMENNKH